MYWPLFFLLLGLFSPVSAAFEVTASSVPQRALGNSATVSLNPDLGFWLNPAHSYWADHIQIQLSFTRLYQLSALNIGTGFVVFPVRHSRWGFGIAQLGTSFYRETQLSLNFSRGFSGKKFIYGFSIHAYSIYLRHYGTQWSMGADVGFQFQVSTRLWIGGSLQNFLHSHLGQKTNPLPTYSRIGLLFLADDHLEFHLSIQKDGWFSPELQTGVAYRFNPSFSIYSAYSTTGNLPSGGFQIRWKRFSFQYALEYHFDLGATQSLGIGLR